jgi:hypothetical protein
VVSIPTSPVRRSRTTLAACGVGQNVQPDAGPFGDGDDELGVVVTARVRQERP